MTPANVTDEWSPAMRINEPEDSGLWRLGDWPLVGGGVLRDAVLGYRVWGRPNRWRDNFAVLPTYYGGAHGDYAPLVGAGRALDPARFCIVAVDLFGNGVSTSPSNAHPAQRGPSFPRIDLYDAVAAQQRALLDQLGMRSVALVAGWSMGGMQAYHWAAAFTGQVKRILPWCAAARCSPHNQAFLEGVASALCADGEYRSGNYASPPERGLRAFGRVYCSWAYSQAFLRRGGWAELGHDSLEALMRAWEADHAARDANDLMCMRHSWQDANVGRNDSASGGAQATLACIEARALLMPCASDLYFPPEDNTLEVQVMPNAELRVVDSDWGHAAGAPGLDPVFGRALEEALGELLADYRPGEGRG